MSNSMRPPRVSLSGQRFGHWLVLDKYTRRGKKQSVYWKCQCQGCVDKTERFVVADHFLSGHSKGCGCERARKLSALRSATTTVPTKASKEAAKAAKAQLEDDGETELLPYHQEQRDRIRRRFQLVRSVSRGRVWFGWYDAEWHQQTLVSEDENDALAAIAQRVQEAEEDALPFQVRLKMAA
jgi:hypothetical protein